MSSQERNQCNLITFIVPVISQICKFIIFLIFLNFRVLYVFMILEFLNTKIFLNFYFPKVYSLNFFPSHYQSRNVRLYLRQIYICVTAVWRWRWHSAVYICPLSPLRTGICERATLQISIRLANNMTRRATGKDPRASSNLHLPLSPIVSANFAHRPNARLGFPRFGKLAIPILRSTLFEHGAEEKSATTPFGRGVSIFQYNAARVRGVSPSKMK